MNGRPTIEEQYKKGNDIINGENDDTLIIPASEIPKITTTFKASWYSGGCGESIQKKVTIQVYKKPKLENFTIVPKNNLCKNGLDDTTITLREEKNDGTDPAGKYSFFKDDTTNKIYNDTKAAYILKGNEKPTKNTTTYFATYRDMCGKTDTLEQGFFFTL